MLQSIGAKNTPTKYFLRVQEAAKNILLGSDIEASIRASFSTILPLILIANKKETTGGAHECLVKYIKDYSIQHLRRDQGSSGPRTRILECTAKLTGRLKRIRNTLNIDPQLKELSIYLVTNSAAFILEFLKLLMSQYEEYTKTSTFPPEQALTTVLDLTVLIYEELYRVCAEVMDTVKHVPGMFLWVFIEDRKIQERY